MLVLLLHSKVSTWHCQFAAILIVRPWTNTNVRPVYLNSYCIMDFVCFPSGPFCTEILRVLEFHAHKPELRTCYTIGSDTSDSDKELTGDYEDKSGSKDSYGAEEISVYPGSSHYPYKYKINWGRSRDVRLAGMTITFTSRHPKLHPCSSSRRLHERCTDVYL